jgi:antitoxin component YwqK of YwqJK toxin-antitoxin module
LIGALLALALGTSPLACPAGAEHHGLPPPEDFEEWCEGRDDVGRARRDGPARRFYDDGGLWVEERWVAGLLDGAFVEYHRGGAKARVGTYARGAKTGRWTIWYDSGSLEEEAGWKDGVLDGAFVSYWRSGAKRAEGRHCGGMQCGTWRTWDEKGALLGTAEYAVPGGAP